MLIVKVFHYGIRCNKLLTQCYIVSSCSTLHNYNAIKKLALMFLYNKYRWKGLFSAAGYQWYAKCVRVFCCHWQKETVEILEERSESMAWFDLVGNDTITQYIWGKNEICRWLQKGSGILLFNPARAVCLPVFFIYSTHGLLIYCGIALCMFPPTKWG